LQYIKEKKLQDPSDPTSINTDEHLKALFGPEDKLKFAGLAQKLTQHLSPAPPIVLEHRIKLKGKKQTADVCYDIMVSCATPGLDILPAYSYTKLCAASCTCAVFSLVLFETTVYLW
jgi:hypothetical protein